MSDEEKFLRIEARLKLAGRFGITIPYALVVDGLDFGKQGPHAGHFHRMLHQINLDCVQYPDRPLLAALAVRLEDGEPGDGFYESASNLGRMPKEFLNTEEQNIWWRNETRRCFVYWANRR